MTAASCAGCGVSPREPSPTSSRTSSSSCSRGAQRSRSRGDRRSGSVRATCACWSEERGRRGSCTSPAEGLPDHAAPTTSGSVNGPTETGRLAAVVRVLRDASPVPFWLDRPDAPEPAGPLEGPTEADLAIVGGGFTGLWAAIQAKEEQPDRDVVLLEQDTIAFGASGRNGGFCDASITHGLANGIDRFPDEIRDDRTARRRELPRDRGDGRALRRSTATGRRGGEVLVARAPHEMEWMREAAERSSASVRTPSSSNATRFEPSSTRRRTWQACGSAAGAPWSTRPGSRGGSAGRRPSSGCGSTSDPRLGPVEVGRRRVAAGGGGPCGRSSRGARDERVPAARALDPTLRGARLRLRPDDRAALGGARGHRSVGSDDRGSPTARTTSTTTGRAATVASCGAATTRSTTGGTASPRRSSSGRRRSPPWRATSSRPSRSSRGCASRTGGAA